MSALKRLLAYNREFARRCNMANWGAALFHVEVERELIHDAKEQSDHIKASAYSAEQSDLEALKLLETVTADGRIDKEEVSSVVLAMRHIKRSAARDHKITDAATV